LKWREPRVGTPLLAAALAFYIFIACYPDWAGIFFVWKPAFSFRSLRYLFLAGVFFCNGYPHCSQSTRRRCHGVTGPRCFVLWNAEFMFQWGAHLIPPRGPISWRAMIRNQFQVVPTQIAARLGDYLFHRHDLMYVKSKTATSTN